MKNKNKKTILVTGGAGFIGSHLVDALINSQFRVVVIDNLVNGKKDYINSEAIFYELDICSPETGEVFKRERPDYVFHLAAQVSVNKSLKDPKEDYRVNIEGAVNILNNSLENNVEKIIFSSSAGVYGDVIDIPTSESHKCDPISPYGKNKLNFENILEENFVENGQSYVALRFSNVYGPRQYKGGECGVVSLFVDNHHENLKSIVYGDGSQTRDYIYVGDVVDALIASMKEDIVGVFNLGTAEEVKLNEVISLIEDVSGREFDYISENIREGDIYRSCLDNQKFKSELNWRPQTNLKEGIKLTFDWLRNINEK